MPHSSLPLYRGDLAGAQLSGWPTYRQAGDPFRFETMGMGRSGRRDDRTRAERLAPHPCRIRHRTLLGVGGTDHGWADPGLEPEPF